MIGQKTPEMELTRRNTIYLSGPYTAPDVAMNVRAAHKAALELESKGWLVIIPHLFHFRHIIDPMPYEYWMDLDLRFIHICSAWTRFSPELESPGSDRELEEARRCGLTIYLDINQVPNVKLSHD